VKTRTVTKIVTVPVAMVPVLDEPPPTEPLKLGVHVVVGADGCPSPYAACLLPIDALSLATQIANARALFRQHHVWMAIAWQRCGAAPVEPSAVTPGPLEHDRQSGAGAFVAGQSSDGGVPGSFGEP
jgi:hypothetical protein